MFNTGILCSLHRWLKSPYQSAVHELDLVFWYSLISSRLLFYGPTNLSNCLAAGFHQANTPVQVKPTCSCTKNSGRCRPLRSCSCLASLFARCTFFVICETTANTRACPVNIWKHDGLPGAGPNLVLFIS